MSKILASDFEAKRWSREYRSLLIREEIATLERIVDLGNLETSGSPVAGVGRLSSFFERLARRSSGKS